MPAHTPTGTGDPGGRNGSQRIAGAVSPSSMEPSQSSSRPLQLSVPGITPPWHTVPPDTHATEPKRHTPTLLPHVKAGPTPGSGASSTVPSQSSSTPLQISV